MPSALDMAAFSIDDLDDPSKPTAAMPKVASEVAAVPLGLGFRV